MKGGTELHGLPNSRAASLHLPVMFRQIYLMRAEA